MSEPRGEAHVRDLLAAYLDDELPQGERHRVEEHLSACLSCRRSRERIERGGDLAGRMEIEELPPGDERRILDSLRQEPAVPTARSWWRRRRWIAAAAASVALLLLLSRVGPDVRVERADRPPTELELAALSAWSRFVEEEAELDLVTDAPEDARRWLEERGLSAALASDRPQGERRRFALRGAAEAPGTAFPAAAVSYRVDDHPVLLLVAGEEDVAGAPRWGLMGKTVLYRQRGGAKLLSWSNSGKTYTLISDLPELGQRACLLCHTDRARRRLVEELGAGAGSS